MKKLIVALSVWLIACPPDGPKNPPTIVSFTASASAVCADGPVTLSWVQADGETLTIDQGVGSVKGSSSRVVNLTATTTFTLTVSNAKGSTSKALTITHNGFAAKPLAGFDPGTWPATAEKILLSADRVRMLLAAQHGQAFTCKGKTCALQTAVDMSDLTAAFATPLYTSLGGDFFAFFSSQTSTQPLAARVYTEVNGVFSVGQTIPGMKAQSEFRTAAIDESRGRIGVLAVELSSLELHFAERINGVWSGAPVLVNNVPATGRTIGNGYASDGTPWILYVRNADSLTLLRRAGAVWSAVASRNVNNGVQITSSRSPVIATTPDRARTVFMWARPGVNENSAHAVTVDMSTNSIGETVTVLPPTPAPSTTLTISLDFNASGSTASYTMAQHDGRAWTGTYNTNSNSFSPPQAFHPEIVVWPYPHGFYDSCDTVKRVFFGSATQSTPWELTVE